MREKLIIQFLKAGLQTTIQDGGRFGFQKYGVSKSGAMDHLAACMANWLVGNERDAPVLEITLLGPKIEITGSCSLALTGADLSPQLNGKEIPLYETIFVTAGSTLSFGRIKNACRCYLAIGGEWLIPKWLNSYSATAPHKLALPKNSSMKKGDIIELIVGPRISKRTIAPEARSVYSSKIAVRVTAGPEFELFSNITIGHFFSGSYKITNDSNRMGYRLDTRLTDFNPDKEVISSGTVQGTIQITNSGQPIILMADAQTTGGYNRIANVIAADMDYLAQLKPGDELRFVLVKLSEAVEALEKKKELEETIFSTD